MAKSYMPVDDVVKLSPDGFSRFFMLVDILAQIYGTSGKVIRILDVGGGSEFLEQQLKKAGLSYDLTVLDIIEKPPLVTSKYIQGDATAMDLADDSFDVVVSTDVLEHIPQSMKQAFLDECLRVSKELCVIAAPFFTEGVHEAETAVNEFNKKLFGSGQDWLEEHMKFGKPTTDLVMNTLAKRGMPYEEFGTQNLHTWIINTHINLISAKLGLDETEHSKVNEFYNTNILDMDDCGEPTYRRFFVIFTDPGKQASFDKGRYVAHAADSEKIAKYWSDLIDLLAAKIAAQDRHTVDMTSRYDQRITAFNAEIQTREAERIKLRETVDDQAETLRKFAPIIKLARKKPVRLAHSVITRHNKRKEP